MWLAERSKREAGYVAETLARYKCAKNIIINDTTNLFLNCNQHFGNFKPLQFPSAV